MDNIAGTKSTLTWVVHISVALLVLLWIFPTVGLLVSSFRTTEQIRTSGWWAALFPSVQNEVFRAADPDEFRFERDGVFVVEGNLYVLEGRADSVEDVSAVISVWGTSSRAIDAYEAGETADLGDGETMTVAANGDYVWTGNDDQISGRGQRIFVTAESPPEFTLGNYRSVLFDPENREGMAQAFFNTLTVVIPATIIPILIAAFAAYALAWMDFPGRALLIAGVVGLLVVPLQLALIPLLSLHNQIGIGKGYLGVWLAHTGFGLPLAIYLLRNYMVGLPKDIIENARIVGATDFQIFTKLILPLSFPALASFAIFQFLWTWNDFLIANTMAGTNPDARPTTIFVATLAGDFGTNEHLLPAAAFVQAFVPLVVFFAMQRYFVRGLLAGSVKG